MRNWSKLSIQDINYLQYFKKVLIRIILFSFVLIFVVYYTFYILTELSNIYLFIASCISVSVISYYYGKYLYKYITTYKEARRIIDKTKVVNDGKSNRKKK